MHITTDTLVVIGLHSKAGCTYWKHKLTAQKVKKVLWTKISFDLGKNECHRSSGLGGRSIVVVIE